MSPQTPIITLFMILLASLVLCNCSYIVEPLHQTNSEYYYPLHDGRLIKTKHQHFGHINKLDTLFSSRSRGMISVDDFGAKADGSDDREVTINNIYSFILKYKSRLFKKSHIINQNLN